MQYIIYFGSWIARYLRFRWMWFSKFTRKSLKLSRKINPNTLRGNECQNEPHRVVWLYDVTTSKFIWIIYPEKWGQQMNTTLPYNHTTVKHNLLPVTFLSGEKSWVHHIISKHALWLCNQWAPSAYYWYAKMPSIA